MAKTIGAGGVFSVLLLIGVGLLCFGAYRATIGEHGFVRRLAADLADDAKATMKHVRDSLDELKTAAGRDADDQRTMRTCAAEFNRGMTRIAQAVHADVAHEAATIEAQLGAHQ